MHRAAAAQLGSPLQRFPIAPLGRGPAERLDTDHADRPGEARALGQGREGAHQPIRLRRIAHALGMQRGGAGAPGVDRVRAGAFARGALLQVGGDQPGQAAPIGKLARQAQPQQRSREARQLQGPRDAPGQPARQHQQAAPNEKANGNGDCGGRPRAAGAHAQRESQQRPEGEQIDEQGQGEAQHLKRRRRSRPAGGGIVPLPQRSYRVDRNPDQRADRDHRLREPARPPFVDDALVGIPKLGERGPHRLGASGAGTERRPIPLCAREPGRQHREQPVALALQGLAVGVGGQLQHEERVREMLGEEVLALGVAPSAHCTPEPKLRFCSSALPTNSVLSCWLTARSAGPSCFCKAWRPSETRSWARFKSTASDSFDA